MIAIPGSPEQVSPCDMQSLRAVNLEGLDLGESLERFGEWLAQATLPCTEARTDAEELQRLELRARPDKFGDALSSPSTLLLDVDSEGANPVPTLGAPRPERFGATLGDDRVLDSELPSNTNNVVSSYTHSNKAHPRLLSAPRVQSFERRGEDLSERFCRKRGGGRVCRLLRAGDRSSRRLLSLFCSHVGS
jgi:hypothetical protein